VLHVTLTHLQTMLRPTLMFTVKQLAGVTGSARLLAKA
jgi:hypothetical protein